MTVDELKRKLVNLGFVYESAPKLDIYSYLNIKVTFSILSLNVIIVEHIGHHSKYNIFESLENDNHISYAADHINNLLVRDVIEV